MNQSDSSHSNVKKKRLYKSVGNPLISGGKPGSNLWTIYGQRLPENCTFLHCKLSLRMWKAGRSLAALGSMLNPLTIVLRVRSRMQGYSFKSYAFLTSKEKKFYREARRALLRVPRG